MVHWKNAAAGGGAGWSDVQPTEHVRRHGEHGHDGKAVGR